MILALQYCKTDVSRSMKLARLLADLERDFRSDVTLAFVHGSGTPNTLEVDSAIVHCSVKFPVMQVALESVALSGWPDGCNEAWIGLMGRLSSLFEAGRIVDSSVFCVDADDGVPLHNNWIDLLKEEHSRTLGQGKLVTGVLGDDVDGVSHVNGNLVLDLAIIRKYPQLLVLPPHDRGWDTYYASFVVPESSTSTVVRNDWRTEGASASMMELHSRTSIWWHGCKDDEFCGVARNYLLDRLHGESTFPELIRSGTLT